MNTLPSEVEALVKSAFCGQETHERWEPLADVGNRLRAMDSSFSPKKYGFTTLVKLLMSLPHLVELKRDDTGNAPLYSGRILFDPAPSPAPIAAPKQISIARYERRGTNVNPITITAEDFLAAIAGDSEEIELENCEIIGEVDIAKSAITQDSNKKYKINKSLVCRSCAFSASLNLRNVTFEKAVSFNDTVFKGSADFISSIFVLIPSNRGAVADFRGSKFEGLSSFKGATFARAVNFEGAHFEGDVEFNTSFQRGSIFNKIVFKSKTTFANATFTADTDFKETQFDGDALFEAAVFKGTANFKDAEFKGRASFDRAEFKRFADFEHAMFQSHVYFIETECAKPLKFIDVRYWPDTLFKSWCHTPTEFHFDSQHIDEGSNPLFKRYVADQQYIRSFRQTNPLLAGIWRWMSDYGRSVVLWAFWSMLFALAFAVAYTPTPDWTPVCWQNLWHEYGTRLNQTTGNYIGKPLTFWDCFYFSIVTFTTLGFGDVVADNGVARFIVTLEVILGYIMLGGLISIFANVLARRS